MDSILQAAEFYWKIREQVAADLVKRIKLPEANILKDISLCVMEVNSSYREDMLFGTFNLNDVAIDIKIPILKDLPPVAYRNAIVEELSKHITGVLMKELDNG